MPSNNYKKYSKLHLMDSMIKIRSGNFWVRRHSKNDMNSYKSEIFTLMKEWNDWNINTNWRHLVRKVQTEENNYNIKVSFTIMRCDTSTQSFTYTNESHMHSSFNNGNVNFW